MIRFFDDLEVKKGSINYLFGAQKIILKNEINYKIKLIQIAKPDNINHILDFSRF
jgi:hypothetical protein